jgi:hypothetical protein
MQELTRMTGQLNNIQLHQIKMWVHGILCADSAVVDFDPDEHVFIVEVSDLDHKMLGAEPDLTAIQNFKLRTEHFNSYVKTLLGNEYGVVIKMKDKVLANFAPTQAPRKSNQDWKRIFTGEKNDNRPSH